MSVAGMSPLGANQNLISAQNRFAGAQKSHVPRIDPQLMSLFRAVPKAELHMHLSGSAPIQLIQQFMREEGIPEDQIRRETVLKNYYNDLDDFLATYYKVPAQIKTPEHFRRAAKAIVQQSANENVQYLEVRSSILSKGGSTPRQIVDAIQTGIHEGEAWAKANKGIDMNVGLIVLAQRAGTPEQSLESAQLAVQFAKEPGSLIRGFDLAGSEGQHTVLKHQEALKYVKAHGLNLTVHAGETESSQGMSGVDSIKAAMSLGADRIGHGLQLVNDKKLMDTFVKKQIPIELCPWSNVQINAVQGFDDHPLPTFMNKGVNASLSTDNRMMSKITLTQQLAQLWANNVVPCWEQVKTLSTNGIKGAFVPQPEKQRLLASFNAQFAQLETTYKDVINKYFCKTCTHPKAKTTRIA